MTTRAPNGPKHLGVAGHIAGYDVFSRATRCVSRTRPAASGSTPSRTTARAWAIWRSGQASAPGGVAFPTMPKCSISMIAMTTISATPTT